MRDSLQEKMQGAAKENEHQEDKDCDYCMMLRTSDMQWVRSRYVGVPASRRYGHSATAIGPHLIIIGGWDGGKALSDVIVLRDRAVEQKHKNDLFASGDEGDQFLTHGDHWPLETGLS